MITAHGRRRSHACPRVLLFNYCVYQSSLARCVHGDESQNTGGPKWRRSAGRVLNVRNSVTYLIIFRGGGHRFVALNKNARQSVVLAPAPTSAVVGHRRRRAEMFSLPEKYAYYALNESSISLPRSHYTALLQTCRVWEEAAEQDVMCVTRRLCDEAHTAVIVQD
ncbi:hypothetical protein EVAR_81985_1 [Eumeta japonica]|uniref:Uncharacterized protein n=1 Tax=Eumeta variegata TaxID=151549 RepID=A0A4C1VXI1_EUMVA|nr:hypothetical protein EVAR_81985_1 [Eumeta japonica]